MKDAKIEVIFGMVNTEQTISEKQALLRDIRWSRPYIVFFIIWGSQGLLAAVLEFLEQWFPIGRWGLVLVGIAIAASLFALWRINQSKQANVNKAARGAQSNKGRAVVPVLLAVGAVWTMGYVQAIDPLYTPLLKSFILAVGYAQLGVWLGKPFIGMGIWLFVLTIVVAVEYLGLASVLLGGFGGVSMLASGWLLYIGNNQFKEEAG
ncbi:hypothetical protein [Paenibacillus agricola]|uniref:Uncharacterized protein n=1 Tax=Paenibacillus agricola TaxID=2716264 RepID=A0ABX0JAK0_9BACL|nr:hypothetical protein [Paenibacillus agricola]NHN32311.1 hypothetical protein [Paenibacillus agricola]